MSKLSLCIFQVTFFLFLCVTNTISSETNKSDSEEVTTIQTTPSILEQWQWMEKRLKANVRAALKYILPTIMRTSTSTNISLSCTTEVMQLIAGLRDLKMWAVSFIDSSGKIPDGMFSGTLSAFGSYDQCLNNEAINNRRGMNYGKVMFRGKYCSIDLKPPLPPKKEFYKLDEVLDEFKNFSTGKSVLNEASKSAQIFYFLSLRFGICVPSSCSEDDINQVVQMATMKAGKVTRCEMKEENEFTPLIKASICAFAFAGLLVLVGTLVDIYIYYSKRKLTSLGSRIILCFSFLANFKKLTNTNSSSDVFSCLNGIRFLSITWIILGHTYINVDFQIFRSFDRVRVFPKEFPFQAIVNASVAVDTFFFIGGMLVCYITIKLTKIDNKKFSIILYIFHRIWRFLPLYIFVILMMFLVPLFGSGPLWHSTMDHRVQACKDNWWTNLLFVNNFVNSDKICLFESWYVACDMQLYLSALIILLLLMRWPKAGLALSVLGIVASIFVSGIITYINKFPPTMLFVHPDPGQRYEYLEALYIKPYPHAGPYYIGMITGYFLITRPKIRMSKSFQILGWCCAIICNMSVLYGVFEWNKGNNRSVLENILYAAFNRVAWAFGVAWLIVCCSTGHGGVVNYILSWKIWIPLGRLTFLSYLIHPIIQFVFSGSRKEDLYPTHDFAVMIFSGYLLTTYGSAFVGCMLVESPFISLEKILIPGDEKSEKSLNSINAMSNSKQRKKNDGNVTILNIRQNNANDGEDNANFEYKF